ncbi:uncharacterized protein [Halyomorpha halys]|uniref:uncharacterized protein isoform X2 n=1 Tax=Halyomorpha halys TaxID=286706 RepID=UPI0034D33B65
MAPVPYQPVYRNIDGVADEQNYFFTAEPRQLAIAGVQALPGLLVSTSNYQLPDLRLERLLKVFNLSEGVKKKLSGLKINLTKNGPEESVVLSDEQTQLLQVIVPQVTGFQNTYGDDESAHDNQIDQNKDNEIGTDSYAVVDGVKVESIEATESFETPTSTSSPQLLVSSSDTVQPSVGPASKLPKATSSNFQYFDPMQLSSLDRSSHPELRTRKRNRPLDKMAAWVASKADIAQQEQIFKKELHEQKKRHLEEEHNLRKQMLEQQLRHAEEQHSWLREEHLEKMKQIKLSR